MWLVDFMVKGEDLMTHTILDAHGWKEKMPSSSPSITKITTGLL
jgi:hypothetical protein